MTVIVLSTGFVEMLKDYQLMFDEWTIEFDRLEPREQRLMLCVFCVFLQNAGIGIKRNGENEKEATQLFTMIKLLNDEKNAKPETNIIELKDYMI